MFGDFMKQFGLSFPWDGVDAQGGLFAQNAPEIAGNVGSTQMGGSPVAPGAGMAAPGGSPQGAPPAAGIGGPTPLGGDRSYAPNLTSPLARQSPLAAPQQGQPSAPAAPAAGVQSPFGPQGT